MTLLTPDDIALLNEAHLGHLAVVDADGAPHVTPVWVDTDGENILINTAKGRVKYNSILGNPAVAMSVSDRANDNRTLAVRGRAEVVEEGAEAHLDRMSMKYIGRDYPFRKVGEVRVIVRIYPTARLKPG